jgi:hypothetical protein
VIEICSQREVLQGTREVVEGAIEGLPQGEVGEGRGEVVDVLVEAET